MERKDLEAIAMTLTSAARPNRRNLWAAVGFALAFLWSCICLASSAFTSAVTVRMRSGPPRPTAMPLPQLPGADVLIQGTTRAPLPVLIADPLGLPHLFWYEAEAGGTGLRHRVLDSAGEWSSPEWVAEHLTADSYAPPHTVVDPDGNVCVFWLGEPLTDEFLAPRGIYWRCLQGEQWSAVESAPGPEDWFGEIFSPGFPTGGGMVLAHLRTDQSIYFGDELISDAGWIVKQLLFQTDSSGGCHLVWSADRSTSLHYRHASDCAGNWQADSPITGPGTEFPPGTNPVFALRADREGNVHAAWAGVDSIYYRRRDSSGEWSPVETVHRETGLYSMQIALAADSDGNPTIAWVQTIPQSYTTGLFYSSPRGGSWDQPSLLASTSSGISFEHPSLAAANQQLYFAWQEDLLAGPPLFNLAFLSLPEG
jgi:hypothetical protein